MRRRKSKYVPMIKMRPKMISEAGNHTEEF